MRKTGFLKRMISMICIISIMTISFVQPSFAANTAPTITSNDGYTYEIEWQNDTDFILTGFINGTAIDRVTGSIGGEYVTLKPLNKEIRYKTAVITQYPVSKFRILLSLLKTSKLQKLLQYP